MQRGGVCLCGRDGEREVGLGKQGDSEKAGRWTWAGHLDLCLQMVGAGIHIPFPLQHLLHVRSLQENPRLFKLQIRGCFQHTAICSFEEGRNQMPDFFLLIPLDAA